MLSILISPEQVISARPEIVALFAPKTVTLTAPSTVRDPATAGPFSLVIITSPEQVMSAMLVIADDSESAVTITLVAPLTVNVP